MHFIKVLFSEVREPTDKFLYLYDLTWETKTTLLVSVGFSLSGLHEGVYNQIMEVKAMVEYHWIPV